MKIDINRHKFHLAFIITAFLLNLSGPSSLILSPRGAHVCNRFLQDSSSSTSWSGEQDSRIVNLRDFLNSQLYIYNYLPKKELFMSLANSSSNLFVACCLSDVFKSMYGLIHADCWNSNTLLTFVNLSPFSKKNFKFLLWQMYCFLSWRVRQNFLPPTFTFKSYANFFW